MARRTKEQIVADNALISQIYHALDHDPRAVAKAIYVVGSNQTESEKTCHAALNDNGIGWGRCDANFGQFLYEIVVKDGYVPAKLLGKARKMVRKYAKTQLFAKAKERQRHFAVEADD